LLTIGCKNQKPAVPPLCAASEMMAPACVPKPSDRNPGHLRSIV
jgi:hypothetical protein